MGRFRQVPAEPRPNLGKPSCVERNFGQVHGSGQVWARFGESRKICFYCIKATAGTHAARARPGPSESPPLPLQRRCHADADGIDWHPLTDCAPSSASNPSENHRLLRTFGPNFGQVSRGLGEVQREPAQSCSGSQLARTWPNLPKPARPIPLHLEGKAKGGSTA